MTVCLKEETLQAYFDGELAPDAAAAVITHLTGCAACADYARRIELALALIDNAFEDELPETAPAARLRARTEEALIATSSPASPSPSGVTFFLRSLLNSLPSRLETMGLSTGRMGLAAAIVIISIILAGALAIRLRRSPPPGPKKDVVQRSDANVQGRSSADQPATPEPRTATANTVKPEEPKRGRHAYRAIHRVNLEPARIEPAPRPMELTEPAPAISAARRAKPLGNAILRNPETSEHLRLTQLLLRSFRNTQIEDGVAFDLAYEKRLSRELLSKNRLLRRSAENKEDSQAEELLSHIEPLLLDIAHLPDKPSQEKVRSVQELIREQKIIATLQIYSRSE